MLIRSKRPPHKTKTIMYFPLVSFLPFLISTLLLALIPSSEQILVETSDPSEEPIKDYNCDKINYDKETYVRCVCLEGLWAFLVTVPQGPRLWRLVGGLPQISNAGSKADESTDNENSGSECFYVGKWVRKIHKLSFSTNESTLVTLPLDGNADSSQLLLVVTNDNSWQVTVRNRLTGETEKNCVQGLGLGSYCFYKIDSSTWEVQEGQLLAGDCSAQKHNVNLNINIKAIECDDFTPNFPEDLIFHIEDDPLICDLIPPGQKMHIRSRTKRQTDPGAPNLSPIDPLAISEDYVNKSIYVGDSAMMNVVTEYMLSSLSRIVEFNPPRQKPKDSVVLPVKYLLEKSRTIAQKICQAIKPDVWEIAMGAFLKYQNNILHMKEPYIDYSAFKRINDTLNTCFDKSEAFTFQTNKPRHRWQVNSGAPPSLIKGDETPDGKICKSHKESMDAIMWPNGWWDIAVPIQPYAYADAMQYEPIVEISWKVFTIVHSHCFKYFSEYYNDHHTFTVAILPFFSNQIQEIWFYNQSYAPFNVTDEDVSYNTSLNWYGGLVTDGHRIFRALDDCYSASRSLYYKQIEGMMDRELMQKGYVNYVERNSGYPWDLDRPMFDKTNKWTRKKRETEYEETTEGDEEISSEAAVKKQDTGKLPCPANDT